MDAISSFLDKYDKNKVVEEPYEILKKEQIEPKSSMINEECNDNYTVLNEFDSYFEEDFDDFEITDEIAVFEAAIKDSPRLKDLVYPRIESTLKDKNNDRKVKKIVNDYVERNMDKLSTPGPLYQLVFGETDKQPYWDLFKITPEEVIKTMTVITKETGSNSQFMLLRQNPIFVILYFLIRYYTIKNDKIGINVFVSMFSLAMYPSIFKKYYPKGCIESVMKYTIDSLTNKFLIKKAGTLFAILNDSGNRAYTFQKSRIINGSDVDVVSYIQRVHNDQNSMFKKITSEYKKNYDAGNYATTKNTEYDSDTPIHDGDENATSVVQYLVDKVALPIISGGVDVVYAEAAATIAKISVSTTRECLMKILLPKNLPKLQSFIESILFLYIYEEKTQVSTIKSGAFLVWAEALFKKTNSKNKNIGNIKGILEEWAKESGVYEKVVEKKAISYKKAIFMYIILMIQKFS